MKVQLHSDRLKAQRWLPGATMPALPPGQIHLWQIRLSEIQAHRDVLLPLLCLDELKRAALFQFERSRDEFLLTRACLRSMLAAYTGAAARDLVFTETSFGKPSLATDQNPDHIQFNLSHSKGAVILAFARHREIGVDVEAVRPIRRVKELAARFLDPAETKNVMRLPEDQQAAAFLTFWVRKEALAKATGQGLHFILSNRQLPTGELRSERVGEWHVWDVECVPGCAAAVAAGFTTSPA